ncbi:MAG: TIGR00730 family Rossman fold protein [Prevotellaceae bacterium]|nr:TIGR00730 family Rossman fold protein [Prevotellaceae bacterium]
MKNVAVFCASSTGLDDIYAGEAKKLGERLANQGLGLVYGGASRGLMNIVADAVLHNGGRVTGVIPHLLADLEITKNECTEIIYTTTMCERKVRMFEIADAVVVLPGGFGTLDELFEALTLSQLKLFDAPIGLLNTDGYYDMLIGLLDNMVAKGFLEKRNKDKLIVSSSVNDLIEKIINTWKYE